VILAIALVAAAIGLRVAAMLSQAPALLGYPDSGGYIRDAEAGPFNDTWRTAGYPLLLQLFHALSAQLSFAMAVQHLLGLGTALLLWLTVRRVAGPTWALIPAAIVALSGPQLLLEHSPLAETPFAFLIALAAYTATRALESGPLPWGYLAGLAGAGAACFRVIGLAVPLVTVAVLLAGARGNVRKRVRTALAVSSTAAALLAGYVVAMGVETGYTGVTLTRAGGWALYGRVAPFADCSRFSPPPGTGALCESRPRSQRPDPIFYSLGKGAPARRLFGDPFAENPRANSLLTRFARTAMLHQPLDYLRDVGTDLTRYWSSDRHFDTFAGQSYRALADYLFESTPFVNQVLARGWYLTTELSWNDALVDALRGYERRTRLEGPLLALLALLAVIGIPLARGDRLLVGVLLLGFAAALLIGPAMTAFFDARYAVPGYGSLAAAGAIGGASIWERLARRARQPRLQEARA
jgi:hypothetical protein